MIMLANTRCCDGDFCLESSALQRFFNVQPPQDDCNVGFLPVCFDWVSGGGAPSQCSQRCHLVPGGPRALHFLVGCQQTLSDQSTAPSTSLARWTTPSHLWRRTQEDQQFSVVPVMCVTWGKIQTLTTWLTLVLMLTLISSSLQLLPVVVQALQAHDTIVKTHPVSERTQCYHFYQSWYIHTPKESLQRQNKHKKNHMEQHHRQVLSDLWKLSTIFS